MSRVEERDAVRASPLRARSLFTVAAAICFARFVEVPLFCAPSLMCSYWRSRLLLHAFCGTWISPLGSLPWGEYHVTSSRNALLAARRAALCRRPLRGAALRRRALGGAALRRAALRGAPLCGAALGRAPLGGRPLGRPPLRGAALRRAPLRRRALCGAALRRAALGGAALRGAALRRRALRGRTLGGRALSGPPAGAALCRAGA